MRDRIVSTTPTDPRAQPLVAALIEECDSRYGDFFEPAGAVVELNRYPPEAFAPPHGHFLLLLRDGETIGGGAFMRYDDETAEFKRVWTRHDLRRQGLASTVLAALEAAARAQGYARIYLTTGFRQPEAVGLYRRRGYTALYDPTADLQALRKLPFEKRLTVAAEPALA
ncbi:GNAT family N-acetyltransferase [Roseomonas sp. 18066]|uniref:GNAT family N-acetyltransferase n=1 Tax=Roseomonas sp. 18066 TaxID=2681412 RepID=UPI00135B0576|nr:GNAT family N-acetyltransferase [Roseomonas sp. 18066]